VEGARAELLSGRVLPQTVTYARGFADPLIGFAPEVRKPQIVGRSGVKEARARHREALAELPPYALQLSRGYPAIPTVFEPDGAEP
jgi:nicotinate phosphoribosyltransferase